MSNLRIAYFWIFLFHSPKFPVFHMSKGFSVHSFTSTDAVASNSNNLISLTPVWCNSLPDDATDDTPLQSQTL